MPRKDVEKIFRERLTVINWEYSNGLDWVVCENNVDNIARFRIKKHAELFLEMMVTNDTDLHYSTDTIPKYVGCIFEEIRSKYKIWTKIGTKSTKFRFRIYKKSKLFADFKSKFHAELAITAIINHEFRLLED